LLPLFVPKHLQRNADAAREEQSRRSIIFHQPTCSPAGVWRILSSPQTHRAILTRVSVLGSSATPTTTCSEKSTLHLLWVKVKATLWN